MLLNMAERVCPVKQAAQEPVNRQMLEVLQLLTRWIPPGGFASLVHGGSMWGKIKEAERAGEEAIAREQAAQEPQPVAWIDNSGHPHHLSYMQGIREKQLYGPLQPLYAAPQEPRKPLTEAQRVALVQHVVSTSDRPIGAVALGLLVVGAVEAAHGIGEEGK